ncbi:MAG: hypothetical protein ACXW5U_31635 [Thermoanaerobaculia bacterium]
MKIVIDMNLSPTWVEYFGAADVHAQHWSDLGDSLEECPPGDGHGV